MHPPLPYLFQAPLYQRNETTSLTQVTLISNKFKSTGPFPAISIRACLEQSSSPGVTFVDQPRLRPVEDERLGRRSAREQPPVFPPREGGYSQSAPSILADESEKIARWRKRTGIGDATLLVWLRDRTFEQG